MKTTRRALITGGNGALGRVLRERLPEFGWAVRSFDITPDPDHDSDTIVGSVEDLSLLLTACEGVDAIVHLGGVANPGFAWQQYLDVNIQGTWNVLEAALRGGVPRVALASSNHAVGYHERSNHPAAADLQARPDSLYGVSKAAMEALGAFYADEHGIKTTSMRIGSCLPRPTSTRSLSTWLSYPDFVRLSLAAIEGPWTKHSTVWGVSRNTRRWWSLDAGRRIGFMPEDDAEVYADLVEGGNSDFIGGAPPPFAEDNPRP